ncbi:MAG: hypothetical protein KAG99_06385, partial [Bacteroidales bacterium]|nr:hypothetical protein [Bacteroidales bacterium]
MRKERNKIFSIILLLLLPVFSDQLKLTTDLTAYDKPKHPGEAIRFRMMQRADENGFIPMDGLVKAKAKIESMQTDDAGLWNWEWLGPGNIGGRIRAILIHPTSTSTMWIGGVAGGIFKSTNGGSSWSVVDDFMANLAITSLVMDPNNYSIMYASTGEGFGNADGLPGAGIFKSTNGGVTWTQLESTNNTVFRWVNRLEHHPDSSGVLYAAITAPHSVWKSNDGGNTWNSVLSTSTRATDVKINPNVPNRVLVGCLNDCYLSNDYGVSWTELTTGAANKLPSNPGRCEVTFCRATYAKSYISMDRNDTGGSDKGEIWWSTDSGVTWSRRSETHYLQRQGW